MKKLARLLLATALVLACVGTASAMQITDRSVEVEGKLDVKTASDLAGKLLKLDAKGELPIYLLITATDGSVQGVMIVADTIRSMKSPVVAVVMTQVHGVGASLAPFADQVVMYPSSALVFTELDYEGVKKPEPPAAAAPAAPGATAPTPPPAAKKDDPTLVLLQEARARFLTRFYARLGKRVSMEASKFQAAVEAGGVIMGADEAVSKKVATQIVEQVTYVALPVEKTEVKVTTTSKDTRVFREEPPKKLVD